MYFRKPGVGGELENEGKSYSPQNTTGGVKYLVPHQQITTMFAYLFQILHIF